MAIVETVLGIMGSGIAVVFGWAWRLESRMTVEEVARVAMKELIISKLEDIDRRLGRIERSMNGHLVREE